MIFQVVVLAAALFSDGFESGDLTAWSSTTTDGGNVSAETAAKLHGAYGLNCLINDNTSIYCQDTTPANETVFRARWYMDPNGIAMVDGDEFYMLIGYNNGGDSVRVALKYTDALGYTYYASARQDGGSSTWVDPGETLTDEPHCFEIYWKAATGVGQNDGHCEIFLDGVSKASATTIDNDTKIVAFVELGVIGPDTNTRGTIFIDDYDSNDDGSEIGIISDFALEKFNAVIVTKWNALEIVKWNAKSIP